jgi:hypothetical protein
MAVIEIVTEGYTSPTPNIIREEIKAINIKPIDQGNLMNRKFTYAKTADTTINIEKRGNTDIELFF